MDWSNVSRAWRDHSLSIVGLAFGTILIGGAYLAFKDANWWDVLSTVGALFLGEGLKGPLYSKLREARKAED